MARIGFTTGSCAAAAAKAAAFTLLSGMEKNRVTIQTPKGTLFEAVIEGTGRGGDTVTRAVRKDGGDDPDITTGALIYAEVSILEEGGETPRVVIDGGQGVGRVTKPGLDQPVGNAAINHVPRRMIEKEVKEVCALLDFKGVLKVVISAPDGEKLAEKTFNPRLGIQGGISILGTSGVVEPMSVQALLDTIRAELSVKRAEGNISAAITPGNYGKDFMAAAYGYELDESVKCSNYIGATIDMAKELGFKKLLLTGHIGKLVKLAGGIMNTHSKEGDCRMELLASAGIRAGAPVTVLREILDCVSTEEAVRILKEAGFLEAVMENILEKAMSSLKRRAGDGLVTECIIYDNVNGQLAASEGAAALLEEIRMSRPAL